jgi:16S rRNA (cytidine1402-2'-O)-methyltransferase
MIAAEDTRTTQVLLNHYDIKKPLISCEKYNEHVAVSKLEAQLDSGKTVALVSDAGTPNIADPGAYVVDVLRQKGIPIVPIPGPSSITTLLSASGQLANQFLFAGFFPKKELEAKQQIQHYQALNCPIVWFETSKRLEKTLDLLSQFRVQKVTVGKELTKKFETILTDTIDNITKELASHSIKGEWVLAVSFEEDTDRSEDSPAIEKLSEHFSPKEIKTIASCLGKNKNNWYNESLRKKGQE